MMRPWLAVGIAIIALALGSAFFQSSSIAFDYMKLRGLPLYSSASSLSEFSGTLRDLKVQMIPQTEVIKGLIRDRATIDIDVAARNDEAKAAVTDAKVFLRKHLSAAQLEVLKFNDAGLSFNAVDAIYQQYCPDEANDNAAAQTASLDASPLNDTAGSGQAPPNTTATKSSKGAALSSAQQKAFSQACAIDRATYCVNEKPDPISGERAQMICAQRALQSAIRKKELITIFDYQAARYLTDALRITYPNFTIEKVDAALNVSDEYAALVGLPSECKPCVVAAPKDAKSGPNNAIDSATSPKPHRKLLAGFWDILLGWPLALAYLTLAFIFGAVGSLTSYLYAFAAPNEVVNAPSQSPLYPILEGGSAGVLVLLLVMAGFQFLTVGASSPDLAYPNPLTVCGLSVLCGLRGDRVLVALGDLLKRVLGSSEPKTGA